MKIVVNYPDSAVAKVLEEALESALATATGLERPEWNAGYLAGIRSVIDGFEGVVETKAAEARALVERHARKAS